MTARTKTAVPFIPRRASVLRILWRSHLWIGLCALLLLAALFYADAGQPPFFNWVLGVVALGISIWRGPEAASMLRAATIGEVRQAKVLRHEDTEFSSQGIGLVRMVWQDATGTAGKSRARLPGYFPTSGTTIIVYCDPRTGKTWWEEAL